MEQTAGLVKTSSAHYTTFLVYFYYIRSLGYVHRFFRTFLIQVLRCIESQCLKKSSLHPSLAGPFTGERVFAGFWNFQGRSSSYPVSLDVSKRTPVVDVSQAIWGENCWNFSFSLIRNPHALKRFLRRFAFRFKFEFELSWSEDLSRRVYWVFRLRCSPVFFSVE